MRSPPSPPLRTSVNCFTCKKKHSQTTLHRKVAIFKLSLWILMTFVSAFFIRKTLIKYLAGNTMITSSQRDPATLRYPDFTICPPFKQGQGDIVDKLRTTAADNITAQVLDKALEEISYPRNSLLTHFSHTWNTGGYNDLARDNHSLWSRSVPHRSAAGVCYTYHPHADNIPGKWTSYKIWLKVPDGAIDTAGKTQEEIKLKKMEYLMDVDMFLQTENEFLYYKEDNMPNMVRIENSLLNYKMETSIVFDISQYKFLDTPERPCSSQTDYCFKNCVNDLRMTTRDWQDPWNYNKEINKTMSTNKTQILEFYDYDRNGHTLKAMHEIIYKSKKELQNIGCALPCNRSEINLQYTYIPREKIDTNWKNEDFDWAISVWAKNFEINYNTEIKVCDDTCLLGEVGGTIGLYLGVSCISLVDLVVVCIRRLSRLSKLLTK